jgi:alpha-amylase
MKRIYFAKRRTLLFILFSIIYTFSFAQDFMMQGWYWDYPKAACSPSDNITVPWADNLNNKAVQLGDAGFTYLWLPPASRASFGACSNGYDPQDLYDLGEFGQGPTGLGTRSEVDALIVALTANGVNAVADVIYNHRDGGNWEDNPGVRDYILNYPVCSGEPTTPYPLNGKVRYVLPLGGSSGNNAGEYYFKFSSASGSSGFNGRSYKIYAETNTTGFQNQPAENESEPNGGGDCSQGFNDLILGIDLIATQETTTGCNTDEFRVILTNSNFNTSGDFLYIYLSQENGDGTGIDIRPYGIYSTASNSDVISQLKVQTRTDFANLPSGQGGMNYLNFKPNGINSTCLTNDLDFPYFFFDIEEGQSSSANVYSNFTEWLWNDVGYRGFRMDAVKHFEPALLSSILSHLDGQGISPGMLVGELFDNDANALKNWVNSVNTPSGMNLRAFDFSLRQALKDACDAFGYDARNVFNSGMVDGANASGFQAVTFVNNHDFRDAGQPVQNDPILAYAYILTNNRVGLPCVFYPDYFGASIPNAPTVNLQSQINALMDVHRNYIFGSTSVDYLNRFGTTYTGNYSSGFANTTLLYQISGGLAGKEIIVAINFAGEALELSHTINTTNLITGETFYDVLGNSGTASFMVNGSSEINIQIPARSYAVWVNDGTVGLPVELSTFEVYPREREVNLQWLSASEINFSHFEIERSIDGTRFENIGNVQGTNQSLYNFRDRQPIFNQTLYYRLKMIDLDGSYVYSDIRSARINNGMTNIKLLPNPTKGASSLFLDSQSSGEAIIEIRDINGHLLSTQSNFIREGNNTLELTTSELAQGVYFVRIQLGGIVQLVKLVKL